MKKMLVFGAILYDRIDGEWYIGGCSTNVAAHTAKLGMETAMISCVGKDGLGEQALKWLSRQGVDTGMVGVDAAHPTGTVEVDISDASDPRFSIGRDVAYDYAGLTEKQWEAVLGKAYDAFYFDTVGQRSAASADTLYRLLGELHAGYRFFDINLRKDCYTLPMIRRSLGYTDILKLNEEEMDYLADNLLGGNLSADRAAARLMERYPVRIILLTRGEKGVSVYHDGGRSDQRPAPAKVVDSVGAGDAFSAAFISSFLADGDMDLAAKRGNLLGGYVVGHRAAVPEYTAALREQMESLLLTL